MAVCPKCGLSFSYAETHFCEGRDKAKLRYLGSVALAVAIGAVVGGPLGLLYGRSLVRHACEGPNATNLCGLPVAPYVPVYIAVGVVGGATAAASGVMLIFRMRKA